MAWLLSPPFNWARNGSTCHILCAGFLRHESTSEEMLTLAKNPCVFHHQKNAGSVLERATVNTSLLKLDSILLVVGGRKSKTAKVETLKPPTTLMNPSPVHVTRCLHVGDQPRYWVDTELGVTCIYRSGTCPNKTKHSIREQSSCGF